MDVSSMVKVDLMWMSCFKFVDENFLYAKKLIRTIKCQKDYKKLDQTEQEFFIVFYSIAIAAHDIMCSFNGDGDFDKKIKTIAEIIDKFNVVMELLNKE